MRGVRAARRAGFARAACFAGVALLGASCQKAPETPPPRLTALAPNRVQTGQRVVLQGTGFAAEPALNAVYFGNARARVESATTNELRVQVPELEIAASQEARVAVRVVVSNLESDTLEVDFLPGVAAPDLDVPAEVAETVIDVSGEPPAAAPTPVQRAAAEPPAPDAPAVRATPSAAPAPLSTPAPRARPTPKPAAPKPTPAPEPPEDPDLARARQELADGKADAALELFEAVLERSPADAEASAGRAEALAAIRSRRSLVTGETRVTPAPASGSGPAGFASDDVEVGAEASPARIGFEVRPALVEAGAAWRIRILLANDGKERISVARLSAKIREDGASRSLSPALRSQRVDGGKREQVGELGGTWGDAVDQWSVEVTVTTDEGVRYAAQLTWK